MHFREDCDLSKLLLVQENKGTKQKCLYKQETATPWAEISNDHFKKGKSENSVQESKCYIWSVLLLLSLSARRCDILPSHSKNAVEV